MRKYFGEKQSSMTNTVILGEDGFLDHMIVFWQTDDTQHMWWDPALPDIQLTEHCHDVFTGKTKPQKLNKNDLIDHLHSSGVVAKGRKADIVSKAKENEIAVEEN